MLLFIECDHSKRCLSISILQMAATRWLLLAACVVSPCAWCTLTSGPRLSYSKLMHHAAKASFKMFISIWPGVFKPPSHTCKTGELLLSCCNTLDCLVLSGISETCSWSVLYRPAMCLQRSTFCCSLVPIRRSHAETAANWTCSASWRKGWLRLHVCHVNFHSPSLFSHAVDLFFSLFLVFCQFFNIFFVDQIFAVQAVSRQGLSRERASFSRPGSAFAAVCIAYMAGIAGIPGGTQRVFAWAVEIFLRWTLMWCAVAHTSFHTTGNSLKGGYLSALLGCNRADCLWFWCAKGAALLWTNWC